MLKFKQFDMSDKEVFEKYMSGRGYIHSEASFTNMFMLAQAGKFSIAYDDSALYIIQDWEDYTPFMLPPYLIDDNADMKGCLEKASEYMQAKYGKVYFKFVTPEIAEIIKKSGFEFSGFEYDADNSEYLYDANALIELKGKKYHSKRNHLKKFVNNFEHELIIYEEKYKEDCLKIHDEWISVRPYSYDEECERIALERALDNFDKLSLVGCIVKADGKSVGFSFAERITEDTVIIHLEKCIGGYDGVYQYINNEFLKRCFSDVKYVNRAEDMGIEGLRKAKLSYYPVRMLERYDIIL